MARIVGFFTTRELLCARGTVTDGSIRLRADCSMGWIGVMSGAKLAHYCLSSCCKVP